MRRRPLALALALVLLGLVAAPVSAATTQRTWYAGITTGAVNEGDAHGLHQRHGLGERQPQEHAAQLDLPGRDPGGTCAAIGTLLTRVGYVTTDATGAAVASRDPHRDPDEQGLGGRADREDRDPLRVGDVGPVREPVLLHRHPRPHPGYSIDLPGGPGAERLPVLQRGHVPADPVATDGAGRDVHLRPRPEGDVPAAAHRVEDQQRRRDGGQARVRVRQQQRHAHVPDHQGAAARGLIQGSLSVTYEKLWLQTSEGPNSSYPKLVIEANRIATSRPHSELPPTPHIVHCG